MVDYWYSLIDDVPSLAVVLQPVEEYWYQLGESLGVKESVLCEIKEKGGSNGVQMKRLLESWCEKGEGTLTVLEKSLKKIGRDDVVSG